MIAGIFGCVFGILGILTIGWIFVPLAALVTLIGLLSSAASADFSGLFVNLLAAALTVIGFMSSPTLLAITGLAVAVSQSSPPSAPVLPETFAWHQGEQLPRGVMLDADGMPAGYEMRSGMHHNCPFPTCRWFEKTPKE